MKRYLFLFTLLSVMSLFSSCEIDNYPPPDATVSGTVIDNATGKPLITEPYGFRIRMEEISWSETPTPRYINGYVDGTFNDKSYFAGTYLASAENGAFVVSAKQTITVDAKKTTTVNFSVDPYIRFDNVSIVKEGATVKATFTLFKFVPNASPVDYAVIAHRSSPYFGMSDNQVSSGRIRLTEADFGVQKVVTLSNFQAGRTYYVRIAAYCTNTAGRYNYSEVVAIQM